MIAQPSIAGWLLIGVSCCLAATYDTFEALPEATYDFVVVGGGLAGSVIANRLTENPDFHVLVIEDGPNNEGVIDSIVPGFVFDLLGSPYDWNFKTTPQKGVNGQSVNYPRGRILGGSSSINAMFYTRGSSSDFDRFARVSGDSGWSWNNIQPYIRKNERWTNPVDNHNTTGQFDPAVHGFHGINSVSLPGFVHPVSARIIQTSQDLADEFPFNLDMNSGNPLGVGWLQSTIKDGERSSAATSYLGPEFRNRRNLHILLNTRVTRILEANNKQAKLSFKTVEFSPNATGSLQRVTAKKEVILSAGTVGTPHVLLNSGIGESAELKAFGIKTLIDLPSVGKNLSDQPFANVEWSSISEDPTDSLGLNATLFNQVYAQWNKSHTGPLSIAGSSQVVWSRIPDDSPIFDTFTDPSSGPNSPHIEIVIATGSNQLDSGSGAISSSVTAGLIALTPVSRGTVKLASSDPFDAPLIDPAILESDFDVFALRESFKAANRFISGPAWKGFILGPGGALTNVTTDAELDAALRLGLMTAAHPVGTSAMSPKGANFGVVDPDLLLKGATGLRIVDASVMPFVTCGHTQAPTYIIAERAADLIKAAWN